MEKDRKFRALAIAAICIAVVGVSVAYAALTASLTITGTATVEAATWNIHWDNAPTATIADGDAATASVVNKPAISANKLTFAVKFTAPGDMVTINAKIVNDGTLAAKLTGNQALTSDNEDLAKYITSTMTIDGLSYDDALNKVLKADGDLVDVVITLQLIDTADTTEWAAVTTAAEANPTVTYTADLYFVQATSNDTVYFNA